MSESEEQRAALPRRRHLRHQAPDPSVLHPGQVDLRGRRPLRQGPGVLRPVLPGHVQGPEVHQTLHELNQHPQEAARGGQAGAVLL